MSGINRIPDGSVVVGIDGSPSSAQALDWACTQAGLEGRALVLAHAIPRRTGRWLDPELRGTRLGPTGRDSQAVRVLDQARVRVSRHASGLEVHEVLRVAEPATLLAELGADALMVVVGSRGLGRARSAILGSVGRALTRHPSSPVVVHRSRRHESSSSEVLVGLDDSPGYSPVLKFAFELAAQRDLSLRLLHYLPSAAPEMWADSAGAPALQRGLAERVAELTGTYPQVQVVTELVPTMHKAQPEIAAAGQAMLVVGDLDPGLSGQSPFFVTRRVLEQAECPVAVVPAGA